MSFTENFVLASQLPACPPNCPLLGLFLGFRFLFLKCFNNVLHDLAADNITVRQGNSSNIVYIFQNRSTLLKSGIRLFGKVDLCYIAGKNHLRTSTNTGKCHFQNRKCGILALINDDHTVIQSTASHICKRCNLNDSPFS